VGARTKSRKRALDVLYAADLRGKEPGEISSDRLRSDDSYESLLVNGVLLNAKEIDAFISSHSKDWEIDRISTVDRNILRIALFELLYCPDVPADVAISEALELATSLSSDDSPGFINGILANVSKKRDDA
jgi:N utilization substance protein B